MKYDHYNNEKSVKSNDDEIHMMSEAKKYGYKHCFLDYLHYW